MLTGTKSTEKRKHGGTGVGVKGGVGLFLTEGVSIISLSEDTNGGYVIFATINM